MMKKISLFLFIVLSSFLFGGYNIKGTISDYTGKDITIKKAEGVSFKNIGLLTTNKKGEFTYRMGEDFEGLLIVNLDNSDQKIVLLTDGKDVTFETSIKNIGAPVFPSNSINYAFQAYIKEANKGNLSQVLDYILESYSKGDTYYKATQAEKERLEKESFNKDYLKEYPLIDFYIKGQEYISKNGNITGEIPSKAERINIISKIKKSNEYLETTNLLGDYVSSYFILGNNIYKSKEDLKENMKVDLDRLLDAADIETERGQLVLTRILDLLKSYGFNDLTNEYIDDVAGLTCEISPVLKGKVEAFGAVRKGAAIPNSKLPNGKTVYDIKAKNKVVLFWSPECSHCLKEFPQITRLYPQLKEKDGEIIAFGADTNKLKYDQLVKDSKWINFYDKESVFLDKYGITAFPTFILLDENNVVKGTYSKIEDLMNNLK